MNWIGRAKRIIFLRSVCEFIDRASIVWNYSTSTSIVNLESIKLLISMKLEGSYLKAHLNLQVFPVLFSKRITQALLIILELTFTTAGIQDKQIFIRDQNWAITMYDT